MAKEKPAGILVAGDFVIDQHIYEGRRHFFRETPGNGVHVRSELGGAALIHNILGAVDSILRGVGDPEMPSHLAIKKPDVAASLAAPGRAGVEAYAFWRPFPHGSPRGEQYWRVSEAMGFGAGEAGVPAPDWMSKANTSAPRAPSVIVLSEGGMGFRDEREAWDALPFGKADWILLKMSAPVVEGALWEHLQSTPSLAKKLVVVVDADDLRKTHARISDGRSWEDSIENMVCELLKKDGVLIPLTRCRHLVVVFGSEAGAWCDFNGTQASKKALAPRIHFVYDPALAEKERARNIEGDVFGLLSCMAASVTWQLAVSSRGSKNGKAHPGRPSPDFPAAIEAGLEAIRDLRKKGHGSVTSSEGGFPAKRLAGIIHRGAEPAFAHLDFGSFDACKSCVCPVCEPPNAPASPSRWSLLRQSQGGTADPAYALARLVLEHGPIALERLPHLSIGKLINADRAEIETLRSLRELINRYKDHDPGRKPLSIGVFGPPGAGKSFAVKQLAYNLVGKEGWLEFNLSQFGSPGDLIGAYHQIRDLVLQGVLPVAFFDEFDAQRYKWLQYLLAPMQDGRFQEGQLTHSIGKCILIFAGGTSWTFGTFGPPKPETASEDGRELRHAHQDFVFAKGPDFKSRLDAYFDVSGPNQRDRLLRESETEPKDVRTFGGWRFVPDTDDLCFPIRRALIIRSELKCRVDQRLDMDEGLAQALLRAPTYTHGARSLTKILDPYKPLCGSHLCVSSLPPRDILTMHTDGDEFLRICMREWPPAVVTPLAKADIDRIAPVIHETYRELGRKQGWLDPKMNMSLNEVADDFKRESNYKAAERMPGVLALVGLELRDGQATPNEEFAVRQRLELHLDLLAAAEHEGWMLWHFDNGWQHAPKRNDKSKLHNCLVPFSSLGRGDKDKDREQIRHYPDFARLAGKKIVMWDAAAR